MNLKSIIETILFVREEPIDIKTLVKITKRSITEVRIVLEDLMRDYADRGFVLL